MTIRLQWVEALDAFLFSDTPGQWLCADGCNVPTQEQFDALQAQVAVLRILVKAWRTIEGDSEFARKKIDPALEATEQAAESYRQRVRDDVLEEAARALEGWATQGYPAHPYANGIRGSIECIRALKSSPP